MRVFVLNSGRCGSTTFARACQVSITNYTAGHETRSHIADSTRLDYPDRHIEADNRLSFFLAGLAVRYPADVFYVHLKREPEAVARSLVARWPRRDRSFRKMAKMAVRALVRPDQTPYSAGVNMTGSWGNGILMRGPDWNDETVRLEACRLFVATTNENISHFLRAKPHLEVDIETAGGSFGEFCQRIGAEFDPGAAARELLIHHNAGI